MVMTAVINAFSRPEHLDAPQCNSMDQCLSDQTTSHKRPCTKRTPRVHCYRPVPEQLESLEVEKPLLDYLVRHRALNEEVCHEILEASKPRRKSLLLEALGVPIATEHSNRFDEVGSVTQQPTTGFALLLNALRHTGHHSLASSLDCGRRITPSPNTKAQLIASEDAATHSNRRRGQLTITIQLDAIKINPSAYQYLLGSATVSSNHPLALDPPSRMSAVHEPVKQHQQLQQTTISSPSVMKSVRRTLRRQKRKESLWINNRTEIDLTDPKPTLAPQNDLKCEEKGNRDSSGCFAFLCLPYRWKKSKPSQIANQKPINLDDVHLETEPIMDAVDGMSRAKLTILEGKFEELCTSLLDTNSPVRDALVKYLEQMSRVLVLDLSFPRSGDPISGLHVQVVATQPQVVNKLSAACQTYSPGSLSDKLPAPHCTRPSELANDLTQVIVKAGILRLLDLQDLRLSTGLDPNEILLALNELNEFID